MKLSRRVAFAWLRIPVRGVDILSVLLTAAGINVVTSAPGSASPGLVLGSGFAIMTAGVMAMTLRKSAQDIERSVESKQTAEREAAEQFVLGKDHSSRPHVKSTAAHLEDSVVDYLDHSPDSHLLIQRVAVGAVLTVAGIAVAFAPVFAARTSSLEAQQLVVRVDKSLASLHNDIVRLASAQEAVASSVHLSTHRATESAAVVVDSMEQLRESIEVELAKVYTAVAKTDEEHRALYGDVKAILMMLHDALAELVSKQPTLLASVVASSQDAAASAADVAEATENLRRTILSEFSNLRADVAKRAVPLREAAKQRE